MNYLSLFSFFMVLELLTIIKKSDKRISFFLNLVIAIILFMCYVCFQAYLLNVFKIKIDSCSFFIYNFIVLILAIILGITKKKSIQKTYFEKSQLFVFILIFSLVLVILFFTFGYKFDISFYSPDAAAHFLSSKYYSLSNNLNASIGIPRTQNFSENFQFFFYTNLGLVYKLFPNISVIGQYNLFVIMNSFVLYLISMSFYYLLDVKKSNKNNLLRIVITIMFTLGYPLNVFLYGFSYWNTGLLLILLILIVIKNFDFFTKNFKYYALFLTNVSLFFSYYLFIPIIYVFETLFLVKHYGGIKKFLKNGKMFFTSVLLLPFFLGFIQLIFPVIIESAASYFGGVSSEGTIFVDIISNYILFIPLIVYILIKEKNIVMGNLFIYNAIYLVLLLLLTLLGLLSSYYFSKVLYLNWILVWYLVYLGVLYIKNRNKSFLYCIILLYFIFFVFGTFNVSDRIVDKNTQYSENTILPKLFSLYKWNYNYIKKPVVSFSGDDLRIVNYIKTKKIINSNMELPFNSTYVIKRWASALIDFFPSMDYNGYIIEYTLPTSYYVWKDSPNHDYIVVEKNKKFIDFDGDVLLDNDVLFATEHYYILKKINK